MKKKDNTNSCPSLSDYIGEYTDCFFESSENYGDHNYSKSVSMSYTEDKKGIVFSSKKNGKLHFDPTGKEFSSTEELGNEFTVEYAEKGGCGSFEYSLFADSENPLPARKFKQALYSTLNQSQVINGEKYLINSRDTIIAVTSQELDDGSTEKTLHFGYFSQGLFLGAMACFK